MRTPILFLSTLAAMSPALAQNESIARGEALCREALPQRVSFKDPSSVRIESVSADPTLRATKYMGTPIMGRNYVMRVNAKNGYGAYTGAKPVECTVDQAASRIIHFNAAQFD